MEPIVASLRSSFLHIRPEGVPALVECILSLTASSPSSLFSLLLKEFPSITKCHVQVHQIETFENEWRNCVLCYFSALCCLVNKSGTSHMHLFIWKVFIPSLKSAHMHNHGLFHEVTSFFLDVVAKTNTWEVLEASIVPFLLKAISVSSIIKTEELVYQWDENSTKLQVDALNFENCDDFQCKLPVTLQDSLGFSCHDFPLPVSCNILKLILNAALPNKFEIVDSAPILENGFRAKDFTGKLLWDLSKLAIQMLSQGVEQRAAAVRFLLPCICTAFTCHCKFEVVVAGKKHLLTRVRFLREIWTCCKLLFSLGSSERRDSYDILSLCLSLSLATGEDVNCGTHELDFDLKADHEFWDEIKRGLLDKEKLVRKQSTHILRKALNLSKQQIMEEVSRNEGLDSSVMDKKGRWADKEAKSLGVGRICKQIEPIFNAHYRWESFLFLYEMLEEYGSHLVEAAWSYQILLLLHSALESDKSDLSWNENKNRMDTAAHIFDWLLVLWEFGFCHGNPQVRCLVMDSFLAIEWERFKRCVKLVPKDFVLGPLLRGLNDPVHHNEFGLKEAYSSLTIEAASAFFFKYAVFLEDREGIPFLIDLACIVKTYSFGRAGLMCLVECISAAAFGFHSRGRSQYNGAVTDENVVAPMRASFQNDRAKLLEVLRFVLDCSKQHFNAKYRYKVCERILFAASSMISAADVPLEALLNFISVLPHEYTDHDGLLRHGVQSWLHGSNFQILGEIKEFTRNFIQHPHPHPHPEGYLYSYDDEELDAWGSEAKRWARVLFIVVNSEEQLGIILKVFRCHGIDVFRQENYFKLLVVKFLILISSLIDELEIIRGRINYCQIEGQLKREEEFPLMVDGITVVEKTLFFYQITEFLFSILEELTLFSESSCSIFWSEMPQIAVLPGSIRGKLGGPSQRRLPSPLCTSALEAMTSVKTLASILRWCLCFKTNAQTDSAQTFLWKLCWKIVISATPASEVEAEMRLAAYEACTCALRKLVIVVSPISLDLVANGNNPSPSEVDDKAPCDAFIIAFMHNVNEVIDCGHLARSRRAVLMNWKWASLESLLSIPLYARQNEVLSRVSECYNSESVASHILCDLVECLENAGEVSTLPMLRSIRLTMELFASKATNTIISSSKGLTIEMMWHLVQSSWVSHVSCKKRKVAPIAALLSAVLHCSVFQNENMHEFNNGPGPLKWLVERIIAEGTKSPRTIRLAALHLCGLWLAYPSTMKYYFQELKLLTFYGSVAFDEDFEAELAENYDAKTEVSMLSQSLDPELAAVFINTELYARVSVAVLFSKLADMAYRGDPVMKAADRAAAISSGKSFLLELLELVVTDKNLSKELYKKHSGVHRRKVRACQMICALSHFVDVDILEQATSNLHEALCRNNMPSVRQYLENSAIYIYIKFPSLVGQQLVPQLRNFELRPQALSSYVFIAANIILHGQKDSQLSHVDELLPAIIPLLTSHHHTLRGFTQILVHHVLQKMFSDPNSSDYSSMSLERRCFVDMMWYLAKNPDCTRLRSCLGNHIDSFDPVKSVSPGGIFTNRVEDHEFECVPATVMDKVNEFLNNTREDLRSSMANDAAAIKNETIQNDELVKYGEDKINDGDLPVLRHQQESLQDFQRKITFSQSEQQHTASASFLNEKTFFGSLSDIENEDRLLDGLLHTRGIIEDKLKTSRQQIILVASLIDRIPNLAGLARTCEVFRAAGLAIADKSVLNDKQFQLISVTAEKWVPIVEVPVASLKSFLEKKKQEGFAILGLEQTANSISLDQYKFPKRTVLVVGREKEGIPVEIIHILDSCIEIPQLGVVRSLNVHVSGAIALWEYTRQRKGKDAHYNYS